MVVVEVEKDEVINNITISGHACYDELGKDIVCASVSSIVITTINGILSIYPDSLDYIDEEGYIKISVKMHNEVVDILIQNMLNLLKELEKDYNKYIEIRRCDK